MAGGHWLALQGVAWSRMFVDFSRTDSIPVALIKTFDGKHPCTLCLRVQFGQQQDQRERRDLPSSHEDQIQEVFWMPAELGIQSKDHPSCTMTSFVPHVLSQLRGSPPAPPPRIA